MKEEEYICKNQGSFVALLRFLTYTHSPIRTFKITADQDAKERKKERKEKRAKQEKESKSGSDEVDRGRWDRVEVR